MNSKKNYVLLHVAALGEYNTQQKPHIMQPYIHRRRNSEP